MRWLNSITNSIGNNLSKLQGIVEPSTLQSMGLQRIGQDLGNEQKQHSHSH